MQVTIDLTGDEEPSRATPTAAIKKEDIEMRGPRDINDMTEKELELEWRKIEVQQRLERLKRAGR